MLVRLSKYAVLPSLVDVGTYPHQRAAKLFFVTSDEQWEHYTDIEKKCKRFNGIFYVVMYYPRAQLHISSKSTEKPLRKWLFLQLAAAYFSPWRGRNMLSACIFLPQGYYHLYSRLKSPYKWGADSRYARFLKQKIKSRIRRWGFLTQSTGC